VIFPLPEFLTGTAVSIQPPKVVINPDPAQHIPPSISIELPISEVPYFSQWADVTTLPLPQVPEKWLELMFKIVCLICEL
jgi:hypothetical protein